MRGGTLGGGLLAAWLAAAPAGAATYATTMDFTGASLDCMLNHNLTGRAFYSHSNQSNCHALEASWDGPFYKSVWGAPICRQGPDDQTCANWGYGCCMTCAQFGATNEHGSGDLNLGKAFAPGEYLQTLTVEPQVPGAPENHDYINVANFEIYFSATGFTDAQGCARQKANVPANLNTGDIWKITVVIPDKGQTVRMDKDGPDSGDGQPMVATVPSKPFKVIVTKKVNGGATTVALADMDVVFQLKNAAGPVGAPVAVKTLADGRASAAFTAQDPGVYTVEAACAGCAGGSPQTFNVTVQAVETRLEKVPGAESGDRQPGKAGTKLELPLRVRVRRTNGVLVANVPVQFSQLSGPGPLQFTNPDAVTNPDGVATTEVIGGPSGDYVIRAFCPSCTGPTAVFAVASAPGGSGLAGSSGTPDYRIVDFTEKLTDPGPAARAKLKLAQTATPDTCGAALQMRDRFVNKELVDYEDGAVIPWCVGADLHLVPTSNQAIDVFAPKADVILMDSWGLRQVFPDPSPVHIYDPSRVRFEGSATDFKITTEHPVLIDVWAEVRWGSRACNTSQRRVLVQFLDIGTPSVESQFKRNLLPGKRFSLTLPFPRTNTLLYTPRDIRRFLKIKVIDVLASGVSRGSIWVEEIPGTAKWEGQSLKLDFQTLRDKTAAPSSVEIYVDSNCPNAHAFIELTPGDF